MSEFCHTCNANENAVPMRSPDECESCARKREARFGPQRIVVTGSREWTCEDTIRAFLSRLPKGSRVAHGACRGADELAAEVACQLGFQVAAYPADWSKGKRAGFERNEEMLDQEKPRRVIAFVMFRNREITPGTAHCIKMALARGIAVTVVPMGARP